MDSQVAGNPWQGLHSCFLPQGIVDRVDMGLQVDGDLLAGGRDLVAGKNLLVDSLWSGQTPLVGRLGQGRLEGVLAIEGRG